MDGEKLSLLTKCSKEEATTLLHQVIDSLCGRIGPKFDDFKAVWDLEQWWDVTDCYKTFCKDCISNNWQAQELQTKLESVAEETRKSICVVIELRRDDLQQSLINSTHAISSAHLKDFDWKLKLAMSSDKLATLHEPLLTVNFDIHTGDGSKVLSAEMNREELKNLIASLESANKAVLQLKT